MRCFSAIKDLSDLHVKILIDVTTTFFIRALNHVESVLFSCHFVLRLQRIVWSAPRVRVRMKRASERGSGTRGKNNNDTVEKLRVY